jgi:cyclic nucleotide gated channel alpha 1
MKDELKSLRSLRKSWALGSIAEEVNYLKTLKKASPETSIISDKETKQEYFPIDSMRKKGIIRNVFVINPDSGLKVLWDLTLLLVLLFKLFIIPYEISFSAQVLARSRKFLMVADIFYLTDIIVQFNTGIHFKGFLITNRVLIIQNYLKRRFLVDFFACFPFQVIFPFEAFANSSNLFGVNYLRFALLVKLLHSYRIKQTIYELEDRFTSIHTVTALKFFHFSLHVTLLIHWTCCMSYLFYLRNLAFEGDLWINYQSDEGMRYLNYLYYILFTVTSIGYYAYNISTNDQKVLNIIIMCFDIIVFAYILGKIESTLNSYQKVSNETQRLLSKCKAFISQNKIPNDLRHRMLRYIVFCRDHEKKSTDKENEILENVSLPLREEIFINTRGHILNQDKIFKIFDVSFRKVIGFHLKLQIFGPNDSIFESGENSSMVYFIQNGEVEIFHAATSTTFKILEKGKSFGEIAFFLGSTRSASARSVFFTELLALNRSTLNGLLNCRPAEKDLTDKLISSAERLGLKVLYIKCYFCKKEGHIAANCKKYVFQNNIKKIAKKIDNSKFRLQRKVNLHENFNFTFQRANSSSLSKPVKIIHSKNKPLDSTGLLRKTFSYKKSFKFSV